jgi:hypothetical protein
MPAGRFFALALIGASAVIAATQPTSSLAAGETSGGQSRRDHISAAGSEFNLNLGGALFDLRVSEAAPPMPEEWRGVRQDVPDLRLVQFTGPTQARWLDQLQAAGLSIVQYIHPCTYIVWGMADDLHRVGNAQAGVDDVRAVGEFSPGFRVLPQWRNLPDAPVDVHFMIYRGADVTAVINQIVALGEGTLHSGRNIMDQTFEVAAFTMPGSLFAAASRIPGVYSIQPVPLDGGLRGEMSNRMNLISTNSAVTPGYAAWLTSAGINGSGVIVAGVDGGINNTHPDLGAAKFAPCVGTSCGGGSNSHGTHTAATIAGTGASGVNANGGFLRGQGVAPGATLIEQVYSPTYTQPNGMLTLMTTSRTNGALLSSNSWGPSGSPLGYDNNTRQCDVGVRDAMPATPGNQSLTYVLSIMNGNGGTSTQGTPDDGKNLFTIGSTSAQSSGSGAQLANINAISSNSAHGPCRDGRKIPHLVAPGCYIDSATTGSNYSRMCGTSMASPHVSGAVALFIQKYRSLPGFTVDPSPALIKAAFLANATDLAGNPDADGGALGHPFDSKQGWGRLNVPAVITPPAGTTQYIDNPIVLNNTGEQWTVDLSPANPALPMRIMLVWTDAPGHGLGGATPAWNNNLNLEVTAGAGTYKGNVFAATGFSATGGTADDRNNTEGVFLAAGAGPVTVRVIGQNITSDGVPGVGDTTDQDFSIVVYNATQPVDCPVDIDNSGSVDVDDLIAVILQWGPCPAPPAACAADVDDDSDVDVDDLIAVILGWGPCP